MVDNALQTLNKHDKVRRILLYTRGYDNVGTSLSSSVDGLERHSIMYCSKIDRCYIVVACNHYY
jgi:hypothetical protein